MLFHTFVNAYWERKREKKEMVALQPPENELQKVGERVPSEHELRVQRSLQRLNVPDWYKNSPAARDGFRLKRHSDASQHGGWRALGSKTTSLSSLSSSSNRQPTTGKLISSTVSLQIFSTFHHFVHFATEKISKWPAALWTNETNERTILRSRVHLTKSRPRTNNKPQSFKIVYHSGGQCYSARNTLWIFIRDYSEKRMWTSKGITPWKPLSWRQSLMALAFRFYYIDWEV